MNDGNKRRSSAELIPLFFSAVLLDAANFALPQQVIGRMAADAQHGLQILDRYNVRVLRKHELVHFSDFFTIHSITILEF